MSREESEGAVKRVRGGTAWYAYISVEGKAEVGATSIGSSGCWKAVLLGAFREGVASAIPRSHTGLL